MSDGEKLVVTRTSKIYSQLFYLDVNSLERTNSISRDGKGLGGVNYVHFFIKVNTMQIFHSPFILTELANDCFSSILMNNTFFFQFSIVLCSI